MNKFSLEFFSLKGKVAVVTGGNKGLGLGLSVALAKAGANLFIITHGTDWEEAKSYLNKENVEVHFFQADLSDRKQIDIAVEECLKIYGKIDILVNNAGTIIRSPILEYKDEDWDAVMALNIDAVYFLSQRVAKVMAKEGHGKIINMASMLSFQGGKFVPPYTTSKHAVAGLTKAFANELVSLNIQVNAIAPGYMKSANTAPIMADKKRNEEILSRIPAGRWGEAADLMGAVVFLASRASDYVNGHILAVDGGWLSR